MSIRDRIVGLERVRSADLRPSPRNWRRHSDRQRSALRSVLDEVGWVDVAIARRLDDGGLELIDGHLRADLEPDADVPVLVVDVDEHEAGLILATLDPLAAMAETDAEALRALVGDLRPSGDDVRALLERIAPAALPVEEAPVPEPPAEPVTQPGDIWTLGEHRLLCGDATNADDVGRLLDGATPRLMVTDPPYGIELDPTWRDRAEANRLGPGRQPIPGDARSDWSEAWRLSPAEVAYVWHGALTAGQTAEQLSTSGFEVRQQIVWVKPIHALGRSAYHWRHETCWYAVRSGASAAWQGGRSETTVWEVASPIQVMSGSSEEATSHATQKPLECMARPIRNHEAAEVYDPFCGSGTTLIAADQVGRRCYAVEIEPRYCDVIVERWQQATGGKAER